MKISRKGLFILMPLCFFLCIFLPMREGKISAHPENLWTARIDDGNHLSRYILIQSSSVEPDKHFIGTRCHFGFPFWGSYYDTANHGSYIKIDTFKSLTNLAIAAIVSTLVLIYYRFSKLGKQP